MPREASDTAPFVARLQRRPESRARKSVEELRKTRSRTNTILFLDRRKADSRGPGSQALTASLLTRDKGVDRILQELDNIAKSIRSGPLDRQALHETLQRAVVCAIRQSTLDRELRSLALEDDLTSLYTRRAFFALATQQIRLMRRKARGLILFFADVDNLKQINDRYGHREGDLALIRVANALQRTFRDSDILARLGGDEFAVLALEASGEEASILSRLKKNVQESSVKETRYVLSVSVGMARFDPRRRALLGDLLAKADEAMYENKRARSGLLDAPQFGGSGV